LVFVILTFLKEGIGNNLTMPSGSWVLVLEFGNGSWDLGLGSGTFDTGRVPFDLFWLVLVKWGMGLS
jgi:hypothetical protein